VAKARGAAGWLAKNRSSAVGLALPGPLAATACNKSRNSAPVATGKKLSELSTRSISPLGRRNLIAAPWGFASGEPSGMAGRPVASEKRAVTGTGLPWNRGALLSLAPASVGVKLPSTTTPFAWLALIPGCWPQSLCMASMVCSAT
jgi:hypothetical protein